MLCRTLAAHWAEFCERAEEEGVLPRFWAARVDLANLKDDADSAKHDTALGAFVSSCKARPKMDLLEDVFTVATARRNRVRERPIVFIARPSPCMCGQLWKMCTGITGSAIDGTSKSHVNSLGLFGGSSKPAPPKDITPAS